METRHTNPDLNGDDLQRPDRAKHDELGRTTQGGRSAKASPREQPAKAVHLGRGGEHRRSRMSKQKETMKGGG